MALFSFVRVLSVAVVCLAAHAVALKFDSTALLELNKNYTIQTPNYPGKLPKNTHYSWLIKAPDGYRIQLVCPKISLIEVIVNAISNIYKCTTHYKLIIFCNRMNDAKMSACMYQNRVDRISQMPNSIVVLAK